MLQGVSYICQIKLQYISEFFNMISKTKSWIKSNTESLNSSTLFAFTILIKTSGHLLN